jgi:ATP-dependent DNA helicase RecQ
MSDGVAWLLTTLRAFPNIGEEPDGVRDWPGPQRRLLDALSSVAHADEFLPASARDIVPLVREVFLARERQTTVTVARHPALPDREQWREGGCDCVEHPGLYTLRIREWAPSWLPGADVEPPARAASEGHHAGLSAVREDLPPADPFYREATGNDFYRTPGQRIGIHTVVAARPGSTIIANLPTRSGKSHLAFVPAILGAARGRTAIVVVPTTALAVDQERQFLDLHSSLARDAPGVLAFHANLSDLVKEDLKRRIRDGSQTIVFTSPEGLVGALRPAVQDAAEAGRIGLLAVDEAHIVSQWGDDFRPEFQALGGVRRILLEACPKPFTTLLMTGTLTATTLDALVMLFGSPVGVHVVSSVDLRAEPSYWQALCESEGQRQSRVLEALHQLPRPLLLYTTRVDDAEKWLVQLRAAGYARVASVTGRTSAERRRDVIAKVRGEAPDAKRVLRTGVDVVVGTSAYGLGVDQPDVRSVVHACIPESIDRFYQEVGRSGRDGAPSVSLVLHTEADRSMAERMALARIIGVDKAQRRWKAMWEHGRTLTEPAVRIVKTNTIPPYLSSNNERNEQWNLLTLLLMQRAAMIDLDLPEPPTVSPEENPEAWDSLWVEHVVRLRAEDLADPRRWRDLERAAHEIHQRDRHGLDLMEEALQEIRPIKDLLAEAYEIRPGDSLTLTGLSVRVGRSHAGCPASRRMGLPPERDAAPLPPALADADVTLQGPLAGLLAGGGALTVLYEPPAPSARRGTERSIRRAVEGLARGGIRTMAASMEALGRTAVEDAWRWAPSRSVFVSTRFDLRRLPGCAALVLASKAMASTELRAFYGARTPRVLIGPSDLADPDRPDRPVLETRRPLLSLSDLLKSLG